jgi:signal transduction histidine kinase
LPAAKTGIHTLMLYASPLVSVAHYDLASFDLSGMIECGRVVRSLGDSAESMEAAAQKIVRFFYNNLIDAHTGERNCALVRCFKTHRLSQLPPELAASARSRLADKSRGTLQMSCLTLLATAGDLPDWNDRSRSRGHAAIPLESVDMVQQAPMIAALLRQMGLKIEEALYPGPGLMLDADQHAFNVFHVEDAAGDYSVPAQASFVQPHGIRSVLGFGGLLPSGELFAIIMFSRTTIPRSTADMFRTIALGVKLALLPHTRGPIFSSDATAELSLVAAADARRNGAAGDTEKEALRSEAATLRMLIPALEQAALHQTIRLKTAFADLQKKEEQVRQQGERLGALLEATTAGVILLDREWRFTFLNNHAHSLMQVDGQDALGQCIWELFPEIVGNGFWTNYHKAMHDRVAVQFQAHYPAPINRWFEVHAFPSQEGIAAFFQDITDRLKTEATLRQTEKLAATGRMAASIAHEINNPLESVTNLLYLLTHDSSLSEHALGFARQAEQELQRVAEITTHMLRFYRQSTSPTEVDIAEVLDSVLVLFQGRLSQSGVRIEKRYCTSRKLRCFAGELRQIFANLVGNAIDACRHGCVLKLRVRETHDPASGKAGLRVTIADTGKGMSRATQARLFEPFFTTKGITGTGLGLWVSLELIRKHDGKVRVRSAEAEKHHGAVFAVFFPTVPDENRARAIAPEI